MKVAINTPDLRVYHGRAAEWLGHEKIDVVFTNPYGFMPAILRQHPMIIHQWVHRKREAELWSWNKLPFLISEWNDNREAFWCANLLSPSALDLYAYRPEPGGWYPEGLVRQIFDQMIPDGSTVWDGFMGRGTIAKIAREHGCYYVGVEELDAHIEIAKDYLQLRTP